MKPNFSSLAEPRFLCEDPLTAGSSFDQSMSLHLHPRPFFLVFSRKKSEEGSMPVNALFAIPFASNIMHYWAVLGQRNRTGF